MGIIERVARAICEEEGYGWESLLAGDATAVRQRKYRSLARAAIEAMREPTNAMIGAGLSVPLITYEGTPARVYSAMIDAALKDPNASSVAAE